MIVLSFSLSLEKKFVSIQSERFSVLQLRVCFLCAHFQKWSAIMIFIFALITIEFVCVNVEKWKCKLQRKSIKNFVNNYEMNNKLIKQAWRPWKRTLQAEISESSDVKSISLFWRFYLKLWNYFAWKPLCCRNFDRTFIFDSARASLITTFLLNLWIFLWCQNYQLLIALNYSSKAEMHVISRTWK